MCMRYEKGDKVRIIAFPNETMVSGMTEFCGRKVTISKVKPYGGGNNNTVYRIEEDKEKFGWMNHDFQEGK